MPRSRTPNEYRIDTDATLEEATNNGVYQFVIAIEDQPIIRKRSSGSSDWLTYRNERVAQQTLFAVQQTPGLEDAELVDMRTR